MNFAGNWTGFVTLNCVQCTPVHMNYVLKKSVDLIDKLMDFDRIWHILGFWYEFVNFDQMNILIN